MAISRYKNDYSITFYALLQITNMIFNSSFVNLDISEWKFVVSANCAQQNCGLYVILNIAALFSGNQLKIFINETQVRHWIYFILKNFPLNDNNPPRIGRLPDIRQLDIDELNIISEPTTNYITNIIKDLKKNKLCKMCVQNNDNRYNNEEAVLCVSCRFCYHRSHNLFKDIEIYNIYCIFIVNLKFVVMS